MVLFGQLVELRAGSGSLVFIVVLVFLLVFEGIIQQIEKLSDKYGFHMLVQKLFREFMIMGFVSFGTYIAFEAYKFNKSEYFDAFHFAHFVVFFIAITFVIQAFLLVFLVAARKSSLLKYSASSCQDLLVEYDEMNRHKLFFFHNGPLFIVYPQLRECMEYKILQEFFVSSFNLPAEFNFANYMCKLLQNYVISLVDVRPINWLLLASLVSVNFLRIKVVNDRFEDEKCKGEGKDSTVCIDFLLRYVGACLALFVLYIIGVLIISEIYMERLLSKIMDREENIEKEEEEEFELAIHSAFEEDGSGKDGQLCSSSISTTTSARISLSRIHPPKSDDQFEMQLMPSPRPGDVVTTTADIPDAAIRRNGSAKLESVEVSNEVKISVNEEGLDLQSKNLNSDFIVHESNGRVSPAAVRADEKKVGDDISQELETAAGKSLSVSISIDTSRDRDVEQASYPAAVAGHSPSAMDRRPSLVYRPISMRESFSNAEYTRRGSDASLRSSIMQVVNPMSGRRYLYRNCVERIFELEVARKDADFVRRGERDSIAAPSAGAGGIGRGFSRDSLGSGSGSAGSKGGGGGVSPPTEGAALGESPTTLHHRPGLQRRGSVGGGTGSKLNRLSSVRRLSLAGGPSRHSSFRQARDRRSYSVDFFQPERDVGGPDDISPNSVVSDWSRCSHILKQCVTYLSSWWHWLVHALMEHPGDPPEHGKSEDEAIAEMQRELGSIFLFGNARAYYHAVEFALFLQCLYVALWATNFVKLSLLSSHPFLWEIVLLLPAFLNFIVLRQVVYIACMLKSVSILDTAVSDQICEEALDERNVTQRLRKLVRGVFDVDGLEREEWLPYLETTYDEFVFSSASNNRRGLNSSQFCSYLHSLQIRLTKASVDRIFKVIDFDEDGFVTKEDLEKIVFPELMGKKKRRNSPKKQAAQRPSSAGLTGLQGFGALNSLKEMLRSSTINSNNNSQPNINSQQRSVAEKRPSRSPRVSIRRGKDEGFEGGHRDSDSSDISCTSDDEEEGSDSSVESARSSVSNISLTNLYQSARGGIKTLYRRSLRLSGVDVHGSEAEREYANAQDGEDGGGEGGRKGDRVRPTSERATKSTKEKEKPRTDKANRRISKSEVGSSSRRRRLSDSTPHLPRHMSNTNAKHKSKRPLTLMKGLDNSVVDNVEVAPVIIRRKGEMSLLASGSQRETSFFDSPLPTENITLGKEKEKEKEKEKHSGSDHSIPEGGSVGNPTVKNSSHERRCEVDLREDIDGVNNSDLGSDIGSDSDSDSIGDARRAHSTMDGDANHFRAPSLPEHLSNPQGAQSDLFDV